MAIIGRDQAEKGAAGAALAGAGLGGASARRRFDANGGPGARRLVASVEIILVLLLGALTGRLILTLVAPRPAIDAFPPPAPRAATAAVAGNPFRRAAADGAAADTGAPDAVETSLDLALHGAWVEADGRGGAIIKTPDGRQKRFAVGETICCGAVLEQVYPDQVTILRGGVREALRLPNKLPPSRSDAGAPPHRAAPQSQSVSSPSVATLADAVRGEIGRDASGDFHLRLFAGADAALFGALGLKDGDALVAINNRPAPADEEGLAAFLASLEGARAASIVVERDGVSVPLDMALAAAADGQ